jgi:hypothetical protein
MNIASNYLSKLQRENQELEAGVAALESVWRRESVAGLFTCLRRTLSSLAKR